MASAHEDKDKGLGVGLLLSVVAALGALLLFVSSLSGDQAVSGWGFAGAMAAAALAVVALHAYE
jgi:hypothetical protein